MPQVTISTVMRMRGNDGCQSIVSSQLYVASQTDRCLANLTFSDTQLLSVISLLSSETPNSDSPANVDAAKEIRTDFAGPHQ